MKCDRCIHDTISVCGMLDCIRHPDNESYAAKVETNTFRDRFVDIKSTAWTDAEKK